MKVNMLSPMMLQRKEELVKVRDRCEKERERINRFDFNAAEAIQLLYGTVLVSRSPLAPLNLGDFNWGSKPVLRIIELLSKYTQNPIQFFYASFGHLRFVQNYHKSTLHPEHLHRQSITIQIVQGNKH